MTPALVRRGHSFSLAVMARDKQSPASTDTERIAGLAADALLGSLSLSVGEGFALREVFKRYGANPAQRAVALDALARELSSRAPDVAAKLCDALAAQVGR